MIAARLRVGVFGCGQVATVGHFPWYRRNPRVDLAEAADPQARKLKLERRLFGIQDIYLADSADTAFQVVHQKRFMCACQRIREANQYLDGLPSGTGTVLTASFSRKC